MHKLFIISFMFCFFSLSTCFAEVIPVEEGFYQFQRINLNNCGYNLRNLPGNKINMKTWYCMDYFDIDFIWQEESQTYVNTVLQLITQVEIDQCLKLKADGTRPCYSELYEGDTMIFKIGDILERRKHLSPYTSTFLLINQVDILLHRNREVFFRLSRDLNESYVKAQEIKQ